MKRSSFIRAIFLAVVCVLANNIIIAQDVEVVIPDEVTGSYVISVESGSFVEEEGNLRLSLNNPTDYANWISTGPGIAGGRYETLFLVGDWAAAPEGTSATALLSTDRQSIIMTLSNPSLDDETEILSYDVTIESITPFDEDDKEAKEMPESFEASTLFITIEPAFVSNLQTGFEVRNTVRFVTSTSKCTPFVNC